MTLTDLASVYLKKSINNIHYVYIFHSLVSTHMMYLDSAFDHYDSILCAGPHHYIEIKQREARFKLPAKNLVRAGYYRLERIIEGYKNYSKKNNKKCVLIAPSWGKKNLLENFGLELSTLLLEAGYKVIIRPHPETVKQFPEKIFLLKDKLKGYDFFLEEDVATDNSIFEADYLISDCSGVVFEYALGTERPVVFIDLPKKIRNSEYRLLGIDPVELELREKLGVVLDTSQINEILRCLSELDEKYLFYRQQILDLKRELVYNLGLSSKVSGDYIRGLLI